MQRFLLLIVSFCFMIPANAQVKSDQVPVPVIGASMQTYSVRLRSGQDLKKEIDAIITQQRIGAGAVLTCVGSLTDVALRLANQDGPTVWRGHFEIVSLVGTLSMNGSHLHLSVSDSTGKTLGGHLVDGCTIYTTAELVIGVMPEIDYVREVDPTFGYKELVVRKRKKK